MAIKIIGNTVIDDSRNITNIVTAGIGNSTVNVSVNSTAFVGNVIATSVTGNLTGNVIATTISGNLTGNVVATAISGNLTGDVTATAISGNLTGNVVATTISGNLTGNVVATTISGNLTGNVAATTLSASANLVVGTLLVANSTVVNATHLAGKTESNLNVNNATTAYGKAEGALNVNAAAQLTTARTIGDVSFNGTSAIVPERIAYKDTRSTDFAPYTYPGATLHLKTNTTDSLVDGGTYHAVLDLTQWTGTSGGVAHQLALTDNNNMWMRTSANATNWNAWTQLVSTSSGTALSANNATNLGGVNAAAYVQNTDSRTLSGNLTFTGANVRFEGALLTVSNTAINGYLSVNNGANVTPDAGWGGHLGIVGSGYTGGASLDGTGMWVGHNSSSRSLIFATNSTSRMSIAGTGNVSISNSLAVNNDLTASGNLGIGAAVSSSYLVNAVDSFAVDSNRGIIAAFGTDTNTAITAARTKYGGIFQAINTSQNKNLDGITTYASTYTALQGDAYNALNTGGNAYAGSLIGGRFTTYQYGNGTAANTVSNAFAGLNRVYQYGSGVIGNAYGLYTEVTAGNNSITGNITTAYGVYAGIISNTAMTIGTGYLFRGIYSGATTAARWGIHLSGEDNNYFSANVGIANAAPTHMLSVNGTGYFGSTLTPAGGLTLGSAALSANGGVGTAGQVLHSNGSATYWAADDAGVTTVTAGNGLSGGGSTATVTLTVGAANGITVGATTVGVTQGTGLVVNSTGVHVNATYIGTLTSSYAPLASPTFTGTVTIPTLALTTALSAADGGTGQTSYAVGDILYASTTSALSKLADVATGSALISGGVGVAPSWGKIGLSTHVSGTLPVGSGGTGTTTSTGTGSVVLSASPTFTGTVTIPTLTLTNDLTVSNGGTGVSTLTGIVKGNGTSAFSAAVKGTDYISNSHTTIATLTTTSGTSHVASGLTLGTYRRLFISLAGVSHNGIGFNSSLTVNGQAFNSLQSSGTAASGFIDIDLYSGGGILAASGSTPSANATTITTADTSVTFAWTGGYAFDAGTIRLIGVQ